MNNINSIIGIVKLLETPRQFKRPNNIFVTKVRVQFPQVRQNSIVHLTFWGNLASYIKKYYKVNDYILIDGYLSVGYPTISSFASPKKKVEITVLKVYPLLLNSNFPKFSTYNQ